MGGEHRDEGGPTLAFCHLAGLQRHTKPAKPCRTNVHSQSRSRHAQQHNSLCFILYFGVVSPDSTLSWLGHVHVCANGRYRWQSIPALPRLTQRLLKVRAGGCQQDARIRKVEAVDEACACAGEARLIARRAVALAYPIP